MTPISFNNLGTKPKSIATPFLKWAGGKGQLIHQLDNNFPPQLKNGQIRTYIEPFVGGGAIFFYIAENYPVDNYYLFDINRDLINAFNAIKSDVEEVIWKLDELSQRYKNLGELEKHDFYYKVRDQYNEVQISESDNTINYEKATQLIFLNKTCFNGLFRVNSSGKFNVPVGKNKNPRIYDPDNLRAVSKVLQKAIIFCGSYKKCEPFIDDSTFVYFDPPYRPISSSASFNSYSSENFNEDEQINLSKFFRKISENNHARLMLSNSDPKKITPEDTFFDDHFKDSWSKKINIKAFRFINSKGSGRGQIDELLILNYDADGKLINAK